ncbi:MAG: hypothetical protein RL754_410 [Bacteroidota bacterium]|jgi:hypothetical protein
MKTTFKTFFLFVFAALLASCGDLDEQPAATPSLKGGQATSEQLDLGKTYATTAQKALGGQLKAAMAEGGPVYAAQYCNAAAIVLTDSVAATLDVSIKRVSDRNRNPNNAAEGAALAYIKSAQAAIAAGNMPMPKGTVENDEFTGFYPIMTVGLCLNCHGERGKQISAELGLVLDDLYPEDKATGYGVDELRGAWVVSYPVDL